MSTLTDEYTKNLERGEDWMRNFGLKPFKGPFLDIDIDRELYCPACRTRLKKGISHQIEFLYCPNPSPIAGGLDVEYCEYEYKPSNLRDITKTFLSENFRYPLTVDEVQAKRETDKLARLEDLLKQRTKINQQIKALKLELKL